MPVARLAADTLVVNGLVRTLDAAGSVAAAVAVKDARIIGVGTTDELRPLLDQQTEVLDVHGRTVLPGFIDGHTHFQKGAVARHLLINWEGNANPESIPAALEQVRQRAAELPAGEWIRADGLRQAWLPEKRMPTRWEIDAVVADRPVILIAGGNHSISANSLALHLAGIDRDTPDPPGGIIVRDESGEPTGLLTETAKLRLDPNRADNVIPKYSPAERLEPLKSTIRDLHAEGITSIHDMMVDPMEIAAWIRLRRQEELELRVQMLIRGIETKTPLEHIVSLGLEHGLGDEWLRFGGVKMSIDGICAHRAAWCYEPYPGEEDNCGLLRIPQDELEYGVAQCHRNNIRVVIHAVGQRAVDMAIDAIDKAEDGTPRPDMRHRLEHVHLPARPGQLERIARLGVIVGAQPSFVWKLGDAWLDIWGHRDLKGIMPLRRFHELGIPVMGGTDFPGTPVSPLLGLRSALARRTRQGEILDADQAVTLDQALRFQTTAAAYGGFEEHLKGSLELGKLADLIVLSDDPYAVEPEQLDQVRVDLTMVGGRVVYTRDGAGF
jgi:predicted amidohydrolase YtcJ